MYNQNRWMNAALQGCLAVGLLMILFSSKAFASNGSKQEPKVMPNYNIGRLSTDWPLSSSATDSLVGSLASTTSTTSTAQPLQVEWWFPTEATKGDPDYLFSKPLKNGLVTYMGMPSFAISNKEKGAGLRGVKPAAGTFPLVVFNHGFASFSRQNNRQAEALAAAGFIVASLSHAEHSLTTEYASGEVVSIDASHPGLQFMGKGADKKRLLEALSAIDAVNRRLAAATTATEYQAAMEALRTRTLFALYISSAEQRINDLVGFVESLIATKAVMQANAGAADSAALLLPHINLDKIGLYGHSLGGVVAMAAGQALQTSAPAVPIGGVLSLDVPQFILPATNPTELVGNGCFLMGGDTKAGRKSMQGTRLNRFLATANAGFCEINIEDAAHQNFTDLSWVTPLKWFGQLGSVSNKKFGRWLNGFVVSYMQHHLQGEPYRYALWPEAELTGNIERR